MCISAASRFTAECGCIGYSMKSSYIMIYSTLNATEAYIVKFLFENNGIEAIVDNDKINFFFGIVSAKDAMIEVWVPGNKYKEAAKLLLEKSAIDLSKYEQIGCPRCGEKNCGLFDYCWKCLANLKSGEAYKLDQTILKEGNKKSEKRPLSLYILIILIALLIAGYIAFFYFKPF